MIDIPGFPSGPFVAKIRHAGIMICIGPFPSGRGCCVWRGGELPGNPHDLLFYGIMGIFRLRIYYLMIC